MIPYGKRLLVKLEEPELVSPGGIALPSAPTEPISFSKVVKVGRTLNVRDSGESDEDKLEEGDTVLYRSYSGDKVTINGEDHRLLHQDDILAMIQKEPTE